MMVTQGILKAKDIKPGQNIIVQDNGKNREIQVTAVKDLGQDVGAKNKLIAEQFGRTFSEQMPGAKANVWQKEDQTRVYLANANNQKMGFASVEQDGIDVSAVREPVVRVSVFAQDLEKGDAAVFPSHSKEILTVTDRIKQDQGHYTQVKYIATDSKGQEQTIDLRPGDKTYRLEEMQSPISTRPEKISGHDLQPHMIVIHGKQRQYITKLGPGFDDSLKVFSVAIEPQGYSADWQGLAISKDREYTVERTLSAKEAAAKAAAIVREKAVAIGDYRITGNYIDVRGNAVVNHREVAKNFADKMAQEMPGIKAEVWQKYGKTRVYLKSPESSRMGFAAVAYDGGVDTSNIHNPTKRVDTPAQDLQPGDIAVMPGHQKPCIIEQRSGENDMQFKITDHRGITDYVDISADASVKKLTEYEVANKSAPETAYMIAEGMSLQSAKLRQYTYDLGADQSVTQVTRQTAQEVAQTPEAARAEKNLQATIVEHKFAEIKRDADKYKSVDLQNAEFVNMVTRPIEVNGTYIGSLQTRDEFALVKDPEGKLYVLPDTHKQFNAAMLGKNIQVSGDKIELAEPQKIDMQIERFGRPIPDQYAQIVEGQQVRLHGLTHDKTPYDQTYKIGDQVQCRQPALRFTGDGVSGMKPYLGTVSGISKNGIQMAGDDGKKYTASISDFSMINKFSPQQQLGVGVVANKPAPTIGGLARSA